MAIPEDELQDAEHGGHTNLDVEVIKCLDSVHQLLSLRDSLSQLLRQVLLSLKEISFQSGALCMWWRWSFVENLLCCFLLAFSCNWKQSASYLALELWGFDHQWMPSAAIAFCFMVWAVLTISQFAECRLVLSRNTFATFPYRKLFVNCEVADGMCDRDGWRWRAHGTPWALHESVNLFLASSLMLPRLQSLLWSLPLLNRQLLQVLMMSFEV